MTSLCFLDLWYVLQDGTEGEHTQVQGCLAGGPANATQTLVVAGYLIVVLA